MNYIIYLGIAVNIIGALFLMYWSIKYYSYFRESRGMTVKLFNLRKGWQVKRAWGWGLMIGGGVISFLAAAL